MQQMPRLGLEVLAVMGLALLALVLTGDGAKGEEALPKLGMMAVALGSPFYTQEDTLAIIATFRRSLFNREIRFEMTRSSP